MSEILEPIMTDEEDLLQTEVVVEKKVYASREEVLARLAEIADTATDAVKGEISYLKMLYFKMRQQETDAELQAMLDGEGDAAAYVSKPDELEPRLKELLNIQREARAKMVEARNKEYAENLVERKALLDKMEVIATDATEVSQQYQAFQDLQKQFKEGGPVDQQEVTGLWKRYTQISEQFYDALKINKELRDYDFKKNLEAKEALCVEAEQLQEATEIVPAFKRLQELHDQWKTIGPVAPNVREEVWNRFKAASTIINKRHQDYFEGIKAQETANEQAKIALCEKLEAIDLSQAATVKNWEDLTKVVLGFQTEWRQIGFASKKVNTKLFERFRLACDSFFGQKAEFYKSIRLEQNENLSRKVALCEKAEALKDSTDWRSTSDQLVRMQQEWKTIGPVPHKQSQALWERFRGACDVFFAAKEKQIGGEKAAELANLARKQEILTALEALKADVANATVQGVRDLMNAWGEVGHVPFKEKDKLQASYKALIDFFFENLDMKGQRRRNENIKQRVSKMAESGASTLQRKLQTLEQDLKTYENNLGFLTAKSKGGNGMVSLMQAKMNDLKTEIAELKKQLAAEEKK